MDKTSLVLKTDNRGRVRTPASEREALLDEFECSSLPATRFSQLAGVRYQTFATWVQKRRQSRRQAAEEGGVKFVEAVLQSTPRPEATPFLSITLPGGAVLRIEHGGQVELAAKLLKALA